MFKQLLESRLQFTSRQTIEGRLQPDVLGHCQFAVQAGGLKNYSNLLSDLERLAGDVAAAA